MKLDDIFEHIEFITESGKALDEFWNEFRDESGNVVYIPSQYWYLFKTVEGI